VRTNRFIAAQPLGKAVWTNRFIAAQPLEKPCGPNASSRRSRIGTAVPAKRFIAAKPPATAAPDKSLHPGRRGRNGEGFSVQPLRRL
jgi:hypothetical protein